LAHNETSRSLSPVASQDRLEVRDKNDPTDSRIVYNSIVFLGLRITPLFASVTATTTV
jgi:hypothetical protein